MPGPVALALLETNWQVRRVRIEQMGPLTVRITGGTDEQGGGEGPVVVLLHGFGAPGHDLVGLGPALNCPAGTRFVFPEAPLALPMPMMQGRAWWMIDVERIQQAAMTGTMRDIRGEEPAELASVRTMVGQMLDAVDEALKPSKVLLGGFSQGAMVSLDVAIQTDRPLAGVMLFSGSFLAERQWRPKMAARAGLPVFQSHGSHDPLLPYGLATELHDALKAAGWAGTFVGFPGGHEIAHAALVGAQRFVGEVI